MLMDVRRRSSSSIRSQYKLMYWCVLSVTLTAPLNPSTRNRVLKDRTWHRASVMHGSSTPSQCLRAIFQPLRNPLQLPVRSIRHLTVLLSEPWHPPGTLGTLGVFPGGTLNPARAPPCLVREGGSPAAAWRLSPGGSGGKVCTSVVCCMCRHFACGVALPSLPAPPGSSQGPSHRPAPPRELPGFVRVFPSSPGSAHLPLAAPGAPRAPPGFSHASASPSLQLPGSSAPLERLFSFCAWLCSARPHPNGCKPHVGHSDVPTGHFQQIAESSRRYTTEQVPPSPNTGNSNSHKGARLTWGKTGAQTSAGDADRGSGNQQITILLRVHACNCSRTCNCE